MIKTFNQILPSLTFECLILFDKILTINHCQVQSLLGICLSSLSNYKRQFVKNPSTHNSDIIWQTKMPTFLRIFFKIKVTIPNILFLFKALSIQEKLPLATCEFKDHEKQIDFQPSLVWAFRQGKGFYNLKWEFQNLHSSNSDKFIHSLNYKLVWLSMCYTLHTPDQIFQVCVGERNL